MPVLDIFNSDAFGSVSLTNAINKLPQQPRKLGDMGIFTVKSIITTVARVEEMDGKLSLVRTEPRGTRVREMPHAKRKTRAFDVPHLPVFDSVEADEVQNIREFGSEDSNALQSVAKVVNDRLQVMKNSLDVTKEWHRAAAIRGLLLDADGSQLFDWFTEFGVTEQSFAFDFSATPTEDVKVTCQRIARAMIFSLGDQPYTGIQAICGDNFWDAFIQCVSVKEAYKNYDNTFLKQQQRMGFMFADVFWMNYTARVGGTDLIPTNVCRFLPLGAGETMQEIYAPANFNETVNTMGQPYYAKQRIKEYDTGIEMHAQSNPLIMCNRPGCLMEGTIGP